MQPFPLGAVLGEFELLVLLALMRLGNGAFGAAIHREIVTRTGRDASISAVYVTLERLERKGYVTSWFSDPQAVRGGKARRFFRLKPPGLAAVQAAKRGLDRLAEGTVVERPVGKKA